MKYAEYVQQIEHLKRPLDEIEGILKDRPIERWCYLVHDQDEYEDGAPKKAHIHVMMDLKSDQTPENIAKWFNDEPNRIEKAKTKNGKHAYANMCSYLIHETESADGKHHYEPDLVKANFDYVGFIEEIRHGVAESKEKAKGYKHPLAEILQQICNDEIPRVKIGDHISDLDQIRYNKDIEMAFKIRDQKIARKKDRDMKVIYITGEAGSGKTTLAKMLGQEKGYDIFVSGSSNDPLEGYIGQECIILDDVRGSDWKINDLLKILDNHTNSLAKSRYSNKLLADCKLMILTSVQPIQDLYKGLKESDSEPIEQLKRRCTDYIILTPHSMQIAQYNPLKKDYEGKGMLPNPVPMVNFVVENESILGDMQKMVERIKADREKADPDNRKTEEGVQMSMDDLPF